MMVGKRLFDLFEGTEPHGRPNRWSTRSCCATSRTGAKPTGCRTGSRAAAGGRAAGQRGRPAIYRPPSRPDVIGVLDHEGLLPAITFVFSRAGCDAAVKQCLRSSLRLTDRRGAGAHRRGDRPAVRRSRRRRPGGARLPRMARGAAARPRRPPRRAAAGLPPHRRGAVHRRAGEGRIRHGDTGFGHQHARPHRRAGAAGQVQRRAARAADAGGVHPADRPRRAPRHRRRGSRRGAVAPRRRTRRRRGTGVDPHVPAAQFVRAVVQHDDQPDPARWAPSRRTSCSSGRSRSSRPTGRSSAWSAASTRGERMLDEIAAEFGGRDAPILDYARLRATISERERAQSRASRLQRRKAANDALAALRRGDIITIGQGRRGGLAVVLEPAGDGDDPRPLVLTEDRWAGRISSADYSGSSPRLGSMTLPKRVEHRQPRVRRDVASALRSAAAGLDVPVGRPKRGQPGQDREHDVDPELAGAARPVAQPIPRTTLADREDAVRVAERYLRIERDNADIQKKVAAATNSLARTFDRIVAAAHRTWLHRDGRRTAIRRSPTTAGCWRASTARATCWSPSACAAAPGTVSTPPSWRRWCRRCSSSRGATRRARRRSSRARRRGMRRALSQTRRSWAEIRADEQRHRLPPSREPDAGFVAAIHRWATTGDLSASLAASDASGSGSPLSAGDFVRWCRQVLDLLDQVRNAAPTPALRTSAKRAIDDDSARRRGC